MSLSQTFSEKPLTTNIVHTGFYHWLTLERVLYGLLLLVAAGLRLGGLSEQPLTAAEAGHAWSAWLVTNGNAAALAPTPDSPLLYALYTLLFWVFGATDATARIVPALCGIGLVVLLWEWRTWLGRTTTLFAALLIALDPWLVAYSRLADSTMLSLFLAMLTLTGLMRLAAAESTSAANWRTTTAISFGLLLVSGPQAWSFLVVLGLFCWFVLAVAPATDEAPTPWATVRTQISTPSVWILVASAAILGATCWLARPEGLGSISTSLTLWLGQITGGDAPGLYSLGWLGWRLLIEQPLALLFGLIGLGAYWRNRAAAADQAGWMNFLTGWLIWGILLLLFPGRTPLVLVVIGLPLLLLAAYGLTLLLQQARDGVAWRENGLLLVVLTILLISFAFWLAGLTTNAVFDGVLARTLLIILALIFLIVLAYTLWLDGRQARLAAGTFVALLLLAWTISSSWQLNQRFDLAYPDGFFATYTNPDVRRLVADVEMLSAQRRGDANEMPVQVEMVGTPDPVLGWYLRDRRNLTWVLAPGVVDGQSPPVVLMLSDAQQVDSASTDSAVNGLAANYLGSRYALRDHWLPATLTEAEIPQAPETAELGFAARMQERLNTRWSARWRSVLRWWIYREAPAIPPSDAVIFWVAADATNP